jgi:hypothetical protein
MVILELVGGTRSESEYRELCEDLEGILGWQGWPS